MKSVIISFILMCTVIVGGACYTKSLITVSSELLSLNYGIQDSLEEGNTEGAYEGIKQMLTYLEDKETVLSAMGNHEELDKIRMNISELKKYTDGENIIDALSKSEVLDFLFRHLPENYKFKIENIL